MTGAPTGARDQLAASNISEIVVLRSIGHRGTPIHGVPFDERRATILDAGGCVTHAGTEDVVPGVYTVGRTVSCVSAGSKAMSSSRSHRARNPSGTDS
jgi:hypothetical protein